MPAPARPTAGAIATVYIIENTHFNARALAARHLAQSPHPVGGRHFCKTLYLFRASLKRGGKVYTKIIPDAKSATLIPIAERKVVPDSIVYSDCWRDYNVLDVSEFHYFRINHSRPLQTVTTTSMALGTSGTKPSAICAGLTVFPRPNSGYI
jgi:transposase-like protein